MRSMQTKLTREFTFAGFSFPKYAWHLPRGSFEKRIKDRKNPVCGHYYGTHTPNTKESGFYLKSDFMPGLRWEWADDVNSSIKHMGWWADVHQDTKIRGIVLRLPKGRGFIPACSMGEGMASTVDYSKVFDDAEECALRADSMAENQAETMREESAFDDEPEGDNSDD